jgi:hypothetical protein
LTLLHERLQSRRRRQRAETVQDIASAYSGCKSKDNNRAMQAYIKALLK